MKALNTTIIGIALAFGALAVYAQAPVQDNSDTTDQTQSGHWRKATDPPPVQPSLQQAGQQPAVQPGDNGADQTMSAPDAGAGQDAPPPANDQNQQAEPQPPANGGWQSGPAPAPSRGGWSRFGSNPMPMAPPRQPLPPTMTLPTGTWITIRVNEPLSSDRNQTGDAFMGTLAQPIIASGIVLAHPGQTIAGRVTEAKKAGRVSGTSRLGLELTGISIADGQQINVHSQMVERRGPTSYGRDAAAIGTTTLGGAAIGAAVNGGVGAGVGAAAGLVASTVGVMLTRGRPTIVYPEQLLTFQLTSPVTITADFNSQAFVPVSQASQYQSSLRPRSYGSPYGGPGYGGSGYGPAYSAAPAPGYYGYPYPYPYYGYYPGYPWFWPSIGIGVYGGWGGGWYHGGWGGYRGGFHGGGRR